jgi:hypothetical protein
MSGNAGTVEGDTSILQGELNLAADTAWRVDFWIGGWDPDALCAFTKGTLQIPYIVDQ